MSCKHINDKKKMILDKHGGELFLLNTLIMNFFLKMSTAL